jgi:hypothetical protein
VIVGHQALSQVWSFIVAPLPGGAAAVLPTAVAEGDVERTTATP